MAPRQCDSVSGCQDHRYVAQYGAIAVPESGLFQRRYRPGGSVRLEEVEGEFRLRGERLNHLHPFERLEPALRLSRLARLVAESIDECLNPYPFAPDTVCGAAGVFDFGGAQPFERTVVSGVDLDAPVTDQGDVIDDRIEELPIVGD